MKCTLFILLCEVWKHALTIWTPRLMRYVCTNYTGDLQSCIPKILNSEFWILVPLKSSFHLNGLGYYIYWCFQICKFQREMKFSVPSGDMLHPSLAMWIWTGVMTGASSRAPSTKSAAVSSCEGQKLSKLNLSRMHTRVESHRHQHLQISNKWPLKEKVCGYIGYDYSQSTVSTGISYRCAVLEVLQTGNPLICFIITTVWPL